LGTTVFDEYIQCLRDTFSGTVPIQDIFILKQIKSLFQTEEEDQQIIDYVPAPPKSFGMAKWRKSQKAMRKDEEMRHSARRNQKYNTDDTLSDQLVDDNSSMENTIERKNIPKNMNRTMSAPVRKVKNYVPYD
jgi:hypothetical protein